MIFRGQTFLSKDSSGHYADFVNDLGAMNVDNLTVWLRTV